MLMGNISLFLYPKPKSLYIRYSYLKKLACHIEIRAGEIGRTCQYSQVKTQTAMDKGPDTQPDWTY